MSNKCHTESKVNSVFFISDENIKRKGINPIDCVGKQGSVLIHCGNVVHRMKPIVNSDRLLLTFVFSPGSNIALNIEHISSSLSFNFDLSKIDVKKRKILSGLFPNTVRQGYNIKKDSLIYNKFKGI